MVLIANFKWIGYPRIANGSDVFDIPMWGYGGEIEK